MKSQFSTAMTRRDTVALAGAAMVSALTVCAAKSGVAFAADGDKTGGTAATSESTETAATESDATEASIPTPTEVALEVGSVDVYDFGEERLHVYRTADALGDVAFIVEGAEALVGIELPAFTESLEAWKGYIGTLGKPMDDMFLVCHPAGASYVEGVRLLGTQGAKDAIASGSTNDTTQGLYETFGEDFHGGEDTAQVTDVVEAGEVEVAGIEFEVVDGGDTYDLVIPSMNAVYTHMLGKTCHSIFVSAAQMDAMLETLKGYQKAGYAMILSSHAGVEGQDAVTEKIAYVEEAKRLAEESKDAEAFTAAMKKAFPDYEGESYLEMSAGYLFA